MVECLLPKQKVVGSNPIARSTKVEDDAPVETELMYVYNYR